MQIFLIAGLIFAWYIKDFDVRAKLLKDNAINVREVITVDFDGEKRHGIFRFIPTYYRGHPVNLKVERVYNVTTGSETHKITRRARDILIKIGSPDWLVSGVNTYMIDYSMRYVVFDTTQADRLVWNVTGNYWNTRIAHARFSMRPPEGVSVKRFECFTGRVGAREKDCECHVKGGVLICETTKGLPAYSGMTVVADFPPGTFSQPGPMVKFWWKFSIFWPILIPVVVFVIMYRKWLKYGRDPEMGSVTTTYEPPADLTPIEAGALIDEVVNPRDFTAEILNLAIKGYISIEETPDKKDFVLVKLKDCDDELEDYQCEILNTLFIGHEDADKIKGSKLGKDKLERVLEKIQIKDDPTGINELIKKLNKKKDKNPEYAKFLERLENLRKRYPVVVLSSLRNMYFVVFDDVRDLIYKRLTMRGFFAGNPAKIRNKYAAMGILIAMASLLFIPLSLSNPIRIWIGIFSMSVASAIVIIFGKYLPRKTEKGVEMLRKLKGLREFIHRVEKDRLKRFALENPKMFKDLLPYAVAFGEEKKWAEVFAEVYEVLREKAGLTTVYVTGSMGFSNMISSMQSSLAPSSSSGSGGGSGGSFSGGGAGGGGGGAW